MTPQDDVLERYVGEYITLYTIDATNIGGPIHHVTAQDNNGQPIVWNGITFQPFPIESDGFETNVSGSQPRPMIRVSNISQEFSSEVLENNNYINASVTRIRTFGQYIGTDKKLSSERFYVSRKTAHNKQLIEFELQTPLGWEGITLPRRKILRAEFPGIGRYQE